MKVRSPRRSDSVRLTFTVGRCTVSINMDRSEFFNSPKSCAEICYLAIQDTKIKLEHDLQVIQYKLNDINEVF